jgi:hypothetical protein
MRYLLLLSPLLFCSLPGQALGHDVWGAANPDLADDATTRQTLATLAEQQPDEDARYVFERGKLWSPGSTIRACFLNGSVAQKREVYDAVAALLSGKQVNLRIDFGNTEQFTACGEAGGAREEIRVTFDDCCAAYIGRDSLLPRIVRGPSVFLKGPPQQHIIQHEFMHVLGVHHEHQSPTANCESRFDYDEISRRWGWSRDQVATNLRRLNANSFSYVWSTAYDSTSIMKYYFDPAFLAGGRSDPCFSGENTMPSRLDLEGLRTAYPPNLSAEKHRERIGRARSIIDIGTLPSEVGLIISEQLKE